MGYELYITRADFWAENEGRRISETEWLRLVDQDPELTIDKRNGPYFAVCSPVPPECSRWLDWLEGNIHTKNPDRKALAKMLQIADLLGASIQGEEGEVYTSVDDYPQSVEIGGTETDGDADHDAGLPRPVKRRWLSNNLEYILVGIAVLVYVLYDLASSR